MMMSYHPASVLIPGSNQNAEQMPVEQPDQLNSHLIVSPLALRACKPAHNHGSTTERSSRPSCGPVPPKDLVHPRQLSHLGCCFGTCWRLPR
jgi:hypothetical protein